MILARLLAISIHVKQPPTVVNCADEWMQRAILQHVLADLLVKFIGLGPRADGHGYLRLERRGEGELWRARSEAPVHHVEKS